MGYVLAAILIISTVFSGGFCRSHSFLGPEFCSGGLEGPQPIVWSRPCRWFVDCVRNDDGSLTAYHEKCPRGLLFDPVSKTCTAAAGGSSRVRPRRMVKRTANPLCNGKALSCDSACKKTSNLRRFGRRIPDISKCDLRKEHPKSHLLVSGIPRLVSNALSTQMWAISQALTSMVVALSDRTPMKVRQRRMVKRASDQVCNMKTLNCDNDCKTLRICAKFGDDFKQLTKVTCGGSTPYCSNTETSASCVSQVPENCDSGFMCTAEGTIPDPKNCSVYHYCYPTTDGTLKDAMGYCDPGYVFSSELEGCKLRTSSYDCHVATCPSGATGFYAFPSEPRFYVVCEAGSPNYVLKCPEGKEYTNKGTCEFVCKKAGKFPNPDVPKSQGYFECLPTTSYGPPYKRYERKCPGDQTFNPSTTKCINPPTTKPATTPPQNSH